MTDKKRKKTTKSKTAAPKPKKKTVSGKRKTAPKRSKKKTTSSSKRTRNVKPRKKIKRNKLKPLNEATDNNIFDGSLPDWIISSRGSSKKKNGSNKKILTICLLASFIFLFFVIRSSFDNTSVETTPPKDKKVVVKTPDPVKKKPLPKKQVKTPLVYKVKQTETFSKRSVYTRDKGPYIVFVLDDVGNTKKHENLLISLKDNITYAILPLLKYSSYFAELSRKTKAEVILHLPIESKRGQEKDPGIITPQMTRSQILKNIKQNFASVPYSVGSNNHKGSLGTSDIRLMRIVLSYIKSKGLFFLDSYTTSDSVVSKICEQLGLPVLKRDIFLDNIDSPDKINLQIEKLKNVASKKGYAIGIGHYRYNTLTVLNKSIPELKRQGFAIISLDQLIDIIRNEY